MQTLTYSVHQINDVVNFGTDRILKSEKYKNSEGEDCNMIILRNSDKRYICMEVLVNKNTVTHLGVWSDVYNNKSYSSLRFKILDTRFGDLLNDISDDNDEGIIKIGVIEGISIYKFKRNISLRELCENFDLDIILFIEDSKSNKNKVARYIIDCDN